MRTTTRSRRPAPTVKAVRLLSLMAFLAFVGAGTSLILLPFAAPVPSGWPAPHTITYDADCQSTDCTPDHLGVVAALPYRLAVQQKGSSVCGRWASPTGLQIAATNSATGSSQTWPLAPVTAGTWGTTIANCGDHMGGAHDARYQISGSVEIPAVAANPGDVVALRMSGEFVQPEEDVNHAGYFVDVHGSWDETSEVHVISASDDAHYQLARDQARNTHVLAAGVLVVIGLVAVGALLVVRARG